MVKMGAGVFWSIALSPNEFKILIFIYKYNYKSTIITQHTINSTVWSQNMYIFIYFFTENFLCIINGVIWFLFVMLDG